MPKWPLSSGPVRKELGCCTVIAYAPALARPVIRHPEVRGTAAPRRATTEEAHPSRLAALAPQDDGTGCRISSSCTVCYETGVGGFWGRAHESTNLIEVFFSGCAFNTGGHVNAGRTRDPQSLAEIAGIETAREHEWHTRFEIFQEPPVERLAEAARSRRFARRARVEQQAVGDRHIVGDGRQVGLRLDGDRLHHQQAIAFLQCRDARWRLLAVKLEQIWLQRFNDRIEQRIVGVDRKRYLLRAAAHAFSERPRRIKRNVARRRRKENKADHVGAGVECDLERFRRRKTADFYNERHALNCPQAPPFYMAARGLSRSRCVTGPGAGAAVAVADWPVPERSSASPPRFPAPPACRGVAAVPARSGARSPAICPAAAKPPDRRPERR